MKTLIAFMLSLSFAASAAESWQLLSTKVEKAKDKKQFIALQKKYPEMFPFGNVKKVVSASVTLATYKFVGTTTCAQDDQRLIVVAKGMSYCDKQGAATVCGSSKPSAPVGDFDPCEFGSVE